MKIRIRDAESCEDQPFLLWDTVWIQNELSAQGGYGDWTLQQGSTGNAGGLQADHALHTAVILQIFTDRRAPEDLPVEDDDPRGWWGDSILLEGEPRPMGSLLWTLERSILNETVELRAKDYVHDALQPLIDQGAVAEIEVETDRNQEKGYLGLAVSLYAESGTKIYDQKFDVLWKKQ